MKTDITIIGAGLVGITAACAFSRLGFNITVIDSTDLEQARKKESDGRTCAIASGSANFFEEIGVWQAMKVNAGEIRDIRVTDRNSPIFLHYDHALVGTEPMGYIVENFYIREALFKRANELSAKGHGQINIIAPAKYTKIEFGDDGVIVTIPANANNASVHRNDDIIIKSKLLIAADGKNSNIRKIAGIRTHEWAYEQSGIVCTIAHEKHHRFTAQERFLEDGPFAVLPMQGGYHSSLVWTEKTSIVPTYLAMSVAEIEEQITLRTGEYLGKISIASPMFFYPLSLCKAKTYVGKNLCLIGDAAHAMHPLAGQGFNVGIRDVIQLYTQLKELEPGNSLVIDSKFLNCYESSRMADSIALIGITDILNRSFSNNIHAIKAARRLGMAAVNRITPIKKFLIKHAMGV